MAGYTDRGHQETSCHIQSPSYSPAQKKPTFRLRFKNKISRSFLNLHYIFLSSCCVQLLFLFPLLSVFVHIPKSRTSATHEPQGHSNQIPHLFFFQAKSRTIKQSKWMTTLWNARGHVNNKCNLKCKGTNTQSTQIKSSNPGLLFLLKSTLEKKEKKITQQQHKKKTPLSSRWNGWRWRVC